MRPSILLLLLGLIASMTPLGCGSDGPVEPVPVDQQPTGAAPPPGQEPVLPPEGP